MAVDVVAVGFEPPIWQAYCEECDKYVSDWTEEVQYAQNRGLIHQATKHTEYSNMAPADSQE